MDKATLEILEWPQIFDQVANLCFTAEGRERLESQKIHTEEVPLRALKNQVRPLFEILQRTPDWPTPLCPPVREVLKLAGPEGAMLSGLQLRDLGIYLEVVSGLGKFLAGLKEGALAPYVQGLGSWETLAKELLRHLDSEGNLIEDSVPALRNLKRSMAKAFGEIEGLARGYLKGENQDSFQTDVPTQKDGRVVLPLKAGHRSRVPGVIHESSASGQTLFMEPLDLVEKNNALASLHREYQIAVRQVLKDLTAQVRQHREEIGRTLEQVTVLDTLLARARWGLARKGVLPEILSWGRGLKLIDARHPLIGPGVVPITLEIDPLTKVLLISGPNAGGKTATLKTLALMGVLHQWGLPLPVREGTALPLWKGIYADIGDGQSLEAQLSTFSSHLKRMAGILQAPEEESLILLDELGTGTDPLEGGALGMTFLEALARRRSIILVTTHHGALKNFAFTQPGYKNASVEFDPQTAHPTYRILTDVPGSSHALETALNMGIPEDLVQKARQRLEGDQTDVARILETLKDKLSEVQERQKTLEEKEKKFFEEKRKSDLSWLRARQKEHELRHFGIGEIRNFLQASRKEFEALIKDLREGTLTPERIKEGRQFFNGIEEQIQAQETTHETQEEEILKKNQEPLGVLAPGLEVILEPSGNRGILQRPQGKNSWEVTVGSLRMVIKTSQIRRTLGPQKAQVEVHTSEVSSQEKPVFSLDLRGSRLDEALEKLENQIDRALISGLTEFSVIHGFGEGVLQKGVRDYLSKRREVKKYFFSHPEEGGFGKTIVQL